MSTSLEQSWSRSGPFWAIQWRGWWRRPCEVERLPKRGIKKHFSHRTKRRVEKRRKKKKKKTWVSKIREAKRIVSCERGQRGGDKKCHLVVGGEVGMASASGEFFYEGVVNGSRVLGNKTRFGDGVPDLLRVAKPLLFRHGLRVNFLWSRKYLGPEVLGQPPECGHLGR